MPETTNPTVELATIVDVRTAFGSSKLDAINQLIEADAPVLGEDGTWSAPGPVYKAFTHLVEGATASINKVITDINAGLEPDPMLPSSMAFFVMRAAADVIEAKLDAAGIGPNSGGPPPAV